MECPYCKKEMEEGKVYKDRYNLKWISSNDDKDFVFATCLAQNAIKLTHSSELYMTAFVCKDCKKLIADIETK